MTHEYLSVPEPGRAARMPAGAVSIDDLDVLRHGGMAKVMGGVRAPSTYRTALPGFTWQPVRQLDANATAGIRHERARWATLRTLLIAVSARVASLRPAARAAPADRLALGHRLARSQNRGYAGGHRCCARLRTSTLMHGAHLAQRPTLRQSDASTRRGMTPPADRWVKARIAARGDGRATCSRTR